MVSQGPLRWPGVAKGGCTAAGMEKQQRPAEMTTCRERLEICGQVQGVGFRPYVYRLASRMGLAGFVANDPRGTVVEVQGSAQEVESFARELISELPPLAEVTELKRQRVEPQEADSFEIRRSDYDGQARARVTIDAAVCQACLDEMNDPSDRRYRYPFINCTDCGPRYSIVQRIPYDRPNTTMRDFQMCRPCRVEYEEPGSRRFHAQPIACPVCGPRVWLTDAAGQVVHTEDPIAETVTRLLAGQILAIKGLGGFHLACRADGDGPVAELRRRKRRDYKPFAVMVGDLAAAEAIGRLDGQARALLAGIERPIVLVPKRRPAAISRQVAPGSDCFGVMLAYTPLHHQLFVEGMPPLVMTSGNVTDEPLAKDNDEAVDRLGPLCDAFLLHNRPIERRVDDAVVQVGCRHAMVVRRSRGYVPRPVLMQPPAGQEILAVGAELKNTICLVRDSQAVLSEHIGDLTDATVYRQFVRTIEHMGQLAQAQPRVIAHDLHPQYLSTQYARRQRQMRRIAVQHHWAHAVSCMAEHGLDGAVIGVVCDGTGYGSDGATWGCEILRVERGRFDRLGHLKYFPLPGGDAAGKELCRTVLGLLHHSFGSDCADLKLAATVCPDQARREGLLEMLGSGTNCPPSSSLGRLFDAVACLSHLASRNEFEGQAPMVLEAVASPDVEDCYAYAIERHDSRFELDVRPMIRAMAAETHAARQASVVSAMFHNTMVELLKDAAVVARDMTKLNRVVLSGGCFMNRRLRSGLCRRLEQVGMEVWTHRQVPCNDGGIALGQAAVAAAVLAESDQPGN